jgi:hypothetical protein
VEQRLDTTMINVVSAPQGAPRLVGKTVLQRGQGADERKSEVYILRSVLE